MAEITPPPIQEAPTNQADPNEQVVEQPNTPVESQVAVETKPEEKPELTDDEKEWADITKEQFPNYKEDDAPAVKPEEKPAENPAEPNKPAEENKQPEVQRPQVDRNAITQRMTQRQFEAEAESVRSDIRDKMFPETEVKAADGTPIRSATDLQQYEDPRTGETFTKEAAEEAWNHHLQTQNQTRAEQEKEVQRIATVNMSIKDEADMALDKYGAFLEANPEVRNQIMAMYMKTVKVDPNTQIITEAPVSLIEFYDAQMRPYIEVAKQQQAAKVEAEKLAEQQRAAEEEKKRQTRADRSDIYSSGKTETKSKEDQEWEDAAIAHYGPLKGLK